MAFCKAFVISGLLLVTITIVVQSVPIHKAKGTIESPSIHNKQAVNQPLSKSVDSKETLSISNSAKISSPTTASQNSLSALQIAQEENDNKKKLYINNDQLDGLLDSESDEIDFNQLPYVKSNNNNHKIDHILHAKIQETSAKIHDNTDKPVDTDDSKVFSDIKMTSNELTDVIRRRRDVKLNDESNRRRKRALSPYDFYDTDSLYDPYADLIEQNQYARPIRSFAPLYWYPSVYERNIRSAIVPPLYDSSLWPALYSSTVDDDDDDDDDENPVSVFDDENDYESNRYPILLPSPNNLLDNLQLQQQYNIDELPIDEDFEQNLNNDDDDYDEQYPVFYQKERPYNSRYGPFETYF
jgi:hypothetical protein